MLVSGDCNRKNIVRASTVFPRLGHKTLVLTIEMPIAGAPSLQEALHKAVPSSSLCFRPYLGSRLRIRGVRMRMGTWSI